MEIYMTLELITCNSVIFITMVFIIFNLEKTKKEF